MTRPQLRKGNVKAKKRAIRRLFLVCCLLCLVVGLLVVNPLDRIQLVLPTTDTIAGIGRQHQLQEQRQVDSGYSEQAKDASFAIPQQLLFLDTRYKTLEDMPEIVYSNIQHTIQDYRIAWEDKAAPVLFFGDSECQQAINATAQILLPTSKYQPLLGYYLSETEGRNKANLCRLVALFLHGGYYFDSDMVSVKPVLVDRDMTFVTPMQYDELGLFNSFIASAPRHAIVKRSLDYILRYYNKTLKDLNTHMGTGTLKLGYDAVMRDEESQAQRGSRIRAETHIGTRQPNLVSGRTFLLNEIDLNSEPRYIEFPRQRGVGCCCHFAVENRSAGEIHFFSRMVGFGPNCRLPQS